MDDHNISFNMSLDKEGFTLSAQSVGKIVRQLREDLNKTATAVEKTERHFNSFSGHFKSFMMTVAATRFALMDLNDVFLALPKAVIKSSAEIERLTKLMEGLSTEIDKVADAKKNRAFVFDMAQNTPFEIKALTDSFIKLKSAGIDPTNGSLSALADSVAKFGGDSQTLHRASIAIQQMAGKGVISMEELRQQLGEAVPTAMKMMAIGVGMSMRDLTASVSKGEVESKSALERMFAVMRELNDGAAAAMMNTWNGLMQRLMTKWELFKFDLGGGDSNTGMFGAAREEIGKLIEAFDAGSLRKFGADLSDIFLSLVHGLSALVSGVVKFYDEIKMAGEVMLATFGASKVVALFGGIKTQLLALSAAYTQSSAKFINDQRNDVLALQVKELALAQSLTEKKAAMVAEEAAATAHFARMNTLYTEYASIAATAQKVVDDHKVKGQFISDAVYATNLRVAESAAVEAIAVKESGIAHFQKAQILRGEILTMDALIATHVQLAEAQIATSFAGTKMAGVLGGLGSIFTALGGWVTVATAIVAAGIWAWMEYGDQAGKAADSARRAWQGISDLKDVKTLDSRLDDVQALLLQSTTNDQEGTEKHKALLAEEESTIKALEKAKANIYKNAIDDGARARIAAMADGASKVSAAYQVGIEQQQRDNQAAQDALVLSIKDPKKLLDAQNKLSKAQAEALRLAAIDRRSATVKYYQSYMHDLVEQSKTASGAQMDIIREQMMVAQKAGDEQGLFLAKASLIGTAADKAKGKEHLNKSPLDTLLESEKAKLAQLNEHFKNLKNDVGGIEGLKAEIDAKIDAMVKGKKFVHMGPDGKPVDDGLDKKRVDELKRVMLDEQVAAKGKALFDELQKRSEELKSGVADADQSMESGVKTGQQTHGINKWLAGLQTAANSVAFESLKTQLKGTGKSFEEFSTEMRKNAATIDLDAFIRPLPEKTKQIAASLIVTERERKEEEYRIQKEFMEKQFALLETAVAKEYAIESEKNARLASERAKFKGHMEELEKQHVRNMETPLQKLSRSWEDISKQMEDASVRWSNSIVDAIVKFSTTGKLEWKSMLATMLTDVLKMRVQQQFGGVINSMLDSGVKMLGGIFKSGAPQGPTQDGGNLNEGNSFFGMLGKAGTGLAGFWNSIVGASEMTKGLTIDMGKQVAQGVLNVAQEGVKLTAEQAATLSLTNLALAADRAALSMGGQGGGIFDGMFGSGGFGGLGEGSMDATSMAGGWDYAGMGYGFADGGIMSEFGAVSLKKYANGGIANSPQLAMFGEGSMNEAYVPLPDGRSIPVSFKGGMGGTSNNVMIQINVAKDGSSDSSAQGNDDGRTWQKMATRIKGVVQEELAVNLQPGGLLYK